MEVKAVAGARVEQASPGGYPGVGAPPTTPQKAPSLREIEAIAPPKVRCKCC